MRAKIITIFRPRNSWCLKQGFLKCQVQWKNHFPLLPFSPGLLTHDTHPGDQQWSRLPPGARLRAQLSDFQYLTQERRKEEWQGPRYHGDAQTLHLGMPWGLQRMQIPSPCSTEGLIPLLWERSRNTDLAFSSFFFKPSISRDWVWTAPAPHFEKLPLEASA